MKQESIFDKLLPANEKQIFAMQDWYVWGASVCRQENEYFMFASAWKKEFGFFGWITHSTIVMGKADKPEGPFRYVREMEELKQQSWSREVLHNPTVKKIGDTYYLYYAGTNGDSSVWNQNQIKQEEIYRYNQKIGVAHTKNLQEPFCPSANNPILEPSLESWDDTYVTNPSVEEYEGEVLLVYKALIKKELPEIVMKLGAAKSSSPEGPFTKITDHPIIDENIEDPFLWKENGRFYLLVKDMTGKLAGKADEAVLYESENGVEWNASSQYAYGKEIAWTTGTVCYTNVERTQIFIEDEKKVCMYNAVGELPENSFNVARRFQIE